MRSHIALAATALLVSLAAQAADLNLPDATRRPVQDAAAAPSAPALAGTPAGMPPPPPLPRGSTGSPVGGYTLGSESALAATAAEKEAADALGQVQRSLQHLRVSAVLGDSAILRAPLAAAAKPATAGATPAATVAAPGAQQQQLGQLQVLPVRDGTAMPFLHGAQLKARVAGDVVTLTAQLENGKPRVVYIGALDADAGVAPAQTITLIAPDQAYLTSRVLSTAQSGAANTGTTTSTPATGGVR